MLSPSTHCLLPHLFGPPLRYFCSFCCPRLRPLPRPHPTSLPPPPPITITITTILQPWTPANLSTPSIHRRPTSDITSCRPNKKYSWTVPLDQGGDILLDPTAAPTKRRYSKRHHRPSTHSLTTFLYLSYPPTARPEACCRSLHHPYIFIHASSPASRASLKLPAPIKSHLRLGPAIPTAIDSDLCLPRSLTTTPPPDPARAAHQDGR